MSVATSAVASRPDWRPAAAGVLFALGLFSLPFGSWFHLSAGMAHRLGYELFVWAWVAAMLLHVARVERRPLSSIGFRAVGTQDFIIAILAGVSILAALAVVYDVVFPALHWSESGQIGSVLSLPYWLNVLIVVRAAVSEEVLFRGYSIERLGELTGSRAIAGAVTCTVFTLDHVGFWGWHHIFVAGLAGAMLTILYLWRRNVWVNILAHFIVDAAVFLLT
jgi:membrane protease YdiL (CAAX protease family)